uniref:Uncharacterized protein n=1 Tax=Arundo donax TaxID=35708 RepID=A0A0A8ZC54_ARUDO
MFMWPECYLKLYDGLLVAE